MDTLKIAKCLEKQGLPKAVSEELVEILNEFTTSDPASKQDLEKATAALHKEIKNTSLNIIKWVAGFLVGQLALFFTLIKLFG